jgi:hypothetical protein
MSNLARHIRLTAEPFYGSPEFPVGSTGTAPVYQHGFVPWSGERAGAQQACEEAAAALAAQLPAGWAARAYIGGAVAAPQATVYAK